jgi:hypothetical protein
MAKSLLLLAAIIAAATAVQYECTENNNFIVGASYSQRSLTDACDPNGVCDNNPVYAEQSNGRVCNKKALEWCKAECSEQTLQGEHAGNACVGFFFQQHQNGHQICGFFHGGSAASVMHSPTAHWVHHNHKAGSICEIVPEAAPTRPEAPAEPVDELQLIQATVQLAAQLVHSEATGDSFELAFRTIVAGSAGHVCGASDALRGCTPSDVVITSLGGVSVQFHLKVANGVLATEAVANIKTTWEDGTAFSAAISAAGVTDVASLKQLLLGEVQVQRAEPTEEEASTQDQDARLQRLVHMLRCPKMWAMLLSSVAGLLLLVMFVRRLTAPTHLRLAEEEPAAAVVVDVGAPKYEMVKDETSKNQV